MPHDLRSEESILNGLYDGKDNQHHEHDKPEVLPCFCTLGKCQDGAGNKSNVLKVRHHVEQADEEAQAYSHGEVDDEEPNAEQHSHDEGNEPLSTEIFVHALLHIAGQLHSKAAIAHGQQLGPSVAQFFIVQQDEYRI